MSSRRLQSRSLLGASPVLLLLLLSVGHAPRGVHGYEGMGDGDYPLEDGEAYTYDEASRWGEGDSRVVRQPPRDRLPSMLERYRRPIRRLRLQQGDDKGIIPDLFFYNHATSQSEVIRTRGGGLEVLRAPGRPSVIPAHEHTHAPTRSPASRPETPTIWPRWLNRLPDPPLWKLIVENFVRRPLGMENVSMLQTAILATEHRLGLNLTCRANTVRELRHMVESTNSCFIVLVRPGGIFNLEKQMHVNVSKVRSDRT
jgi:hypothetical protein